MITLQADLDTMQQWERTWDMEFNTGKCQVLQVTRSRKPLSTKYTLHSQVLGTVNYIQRLEQEQPHK